MEARENIVGQATETVANALIPQKNDKQKWWQQITEYSLIVIFVVMFLTMSLTVDHFFSIENMLGLALSISQIGMVACTMMFCLASRDFDLSVGSTIAFAGVLCAMVLNATDNTAIAIVASRLRKADREEPCCNQNALSSASSSRDASPASPRAARTSTSASSA